MKSGRVKGMPFRRKARRFLRCALGLMLLAGPAAADGEFLQFDLSEKTTVGVASIARDAFSFGGAYVDYDGGRSLVLHALYAVPLGEGSSPTTVRIGPSLGFIDEDVVSGGPDAELGLKLAVERYQPTAFGGLFLLADMNTIDSAWFALAQAQLSGPGISVELSAGGSDSYEETTLAVSRRFGTSPVSLRAGYRFDADELFLGLSYNTF